MRNAGLIVFLNKQDILERKIKQGRKLEKYFPEFSNFMVKQTSEDPNFEYERAKLFMEKKIKVLYYLKKSYMLLIWFYSYLIVLLSILHILEDYVISEGDSIDSTLLLFPFLNVCFNSLILKYFL